MAATLKKKTPKWLDSCRFYVDHKALKNLSHYKYGCTDNSILGNLILNPLYGKMVHLIPHTPYFTLAPNMITLLALLCTLMGYAAICFHANNLEGDSPKWTYLFAGWMVLAYQTLDGLDGKQARRTSTSSALGELFDHGCDAVNTVLMGLSTGTVMQITPSLLAFGCIMVLLFGFYLATWEEYHTGTLVHPHFSVPSEGLLMVATLYFTTYHTGTGIWKQNFWTLTGIDIKNNGILGMLNLPEYLPVNHALIMFIIVLGVILGFTNILRVIEARRKLNTNDVHLPGHGTSAFEAIFQLFPYLSLTLVAYTWMRTGQFSEHPHFFILTIGLNFARQVGYIITSHVTHVKPTWYKTAPWSSLVVGLLLEQSADLAFGVELCLYVHFVVSVVSDFCYYLNISALTIKYNDISNKNK